MFIGALLTASLLTATPVDVPTVPTINTEAKFVVELDHADLSYLKTTPLAIMGDSISTFSGVSLEGGSEPVYPDSYVTDYSQMWFSELNHQAVSAVSGSYVTHIEDGEFENFNSDTRVSALEDCTTVVIYGGTNDLLAGVSNESFESGLRSLVSNVQYGDLRTTILCTLPPNKHKGAEGATYRSYNKIIRKVASETGSTLCEFEDAWSKAEIDQCTEDGIHPNAEGMSRLAARFD